MKSIIDDTCGQAASDFWHLPYLVLAAGVILAWELAQDVVHWVTTVTLDGVIAGLVMWATAPKYSIVDIVNGAIPIAGVALIAVVVVAGLFGALPRP